MSTDQQQLERYTKERAALEGQRRTIDTKIEALDRVIGGLRVLTGAAPSKARRSGKATGTKAVILDVLADGKPRACRVIAELAKVTTSAVGIHLRELEATKEVERRGQGRSTVYLIP